MRVYRGSEGIDAAHRGCVLTVGSFDGMHLGHRALIDAVSERAHSLGVPSAVYTFDPHPQRLLRPDQAPRLLMTWEQLEDALEAEGIDLLIRERFNRQFASLGAEEFLRDVLNRRIAPAEVFVGRDFHFGKGRDGSDTTLARIGPELGFRVVIIPQVRVGEDDVSSTGIRAAVESGDVSLAARFLGRPYAIRGTVVHGDHRGRTIGFPTANVETPNEILPAFGVFASKLRILGDPSEVPRPAVANVGTRPTFEPGRVLTEAHLLDFDGDLYGRSVEVSFVERIRSERRFPDIDALRAQIALDADRAREILHAKARPT